MKLLLLLLCLGPSRLPADQQALAALHAQVVPGRIQIVRNSDDFFDQGKATITPSGLAFLQDLAVVLAAHPHARVTVGVHTDDRGLDDFNLALSQARADAIVQTLGGGNITGTGYGETRPAGDDRSANGRLRNRRIEILIED